MPGPDLRMANKDLNTKVAESRRRDGSNHLLEGGNGNEGDEGRNEGGLFVYLYKW